MAHIGQVTIENFKSIRKADITLSGLDVVIGLNGTGKSNLLSFFSMLGHVRTGGLQAFVEARSGGAASLLHGGPEVSLTMSWRVHLQRNDWKNSYSATLEYSADGSLVFQNELIEAQRNNEIPSQVNLHSSSRESRMHDPTVSAQANVRAVWTSLRDTRFFQFHNTSYKSRIRQRPDIDTASQLWDDGGNLGAFLARLRFEAPTNYERVRSVCRKVLPWFDDFVFSDKGPPRITVREKSGWLFEAHQISDGSLRFFALTALLGQPIQWSPDFVCIDEPELGLFPAALSELADMVSTRTEEGVQVLLATQSRDLLRYLDVEPIVAERSPTSSAQTEFRRISLIDLDQWYDNYTQGAEFEGR